VTTARTIWDQVKNALDYLVDADLALFANEIALGNTRVSWHSSSGGRAFLESNEHPSIEQYLVWLEAGQYSALLFDASLLQITYEVEGGEVVGHRLGYFPCPYDIDRELLHSGEPAADVVEIYRDSDAILRSPIRFDFDPDAGGPGHPASHMTLNSVSCRIACVAPLGILRFLDFIFCHFYPDLRAVHAPFFTAGSWRHVGQPTLDASDRQRSHLMWDVHATATGGAFGR